MRFKCEYIIAVLSGMLLCGPASGYELNNSFAGDEIILQYSGKNIEAIGAVYKQIMRNSRGTPKHSPLALARSIVRVARKHGLDPLLVSAIASVESGYYVGAVNRRSKDYGIMQVSLRNIKHYGWNKQRVLNDVDYSLERGAIVLAWFFKQYRQKEPKTWFCRYNVGTTKFKGRRGRALARVCAKYVAKVRKAY